MATGKHIYCYEVFLAPESAAGRRLGEKVYIWAHHHEVLMTGAVSFYNKIEFESQPTKFTFWKTFANGEWTDFGTVKQPDGTCKVIGTPPFGSKNDDY